MRVDYPWLQDAAARLDEYRRRDRLPHALLLTGPAELGKLGLARAFLADVLCRSPGDGGACGHCDGCLQYAAGSHPDLHELGFEADDKGKLRTQIVVGQVRRLSEKLGMTARQGGWKVALIHPADAMNNNAANSLLKTLEEPPARSLLLLVTSRPASLPATIRSRCQQLAVARPLTATGLAWLREQGVPAPEAALAYAANVPLHAQALAESGFLKRRGELLQRLVAVHMRAASAVTVAAELAEFLPETTVELLDAVCEDLVRLRQVPGPDAPLRNPDLLNSLKTLAERVDLTTLHRYREALRDARRMLATTVNKELLLESLLLPWAAGMNAAANDRILDRLLED